MMVNKQKLKYYYYLMVNYYECDMDDEHKDNLCESMVVAKLSISSSYYINDVIEQLLKACFSMNRYYDLYHTGKKYSIDDMIELVESFGIEVVE